MTKYITVTPSQAKSLVDRWNDLANSSYQLTYDEAHLIMDRDNFDADLVEFGVAPVEVSRHASKTGNPVDLAVWASDVSISPDLSLIGLKQRGLAQ